MKKCPVCNKIKISDNDKACINCTLRIMSRKKEEFQDNALKIVNKQENGKTI